MSLDADELDDQVATGVVEGEIGDAPAPRCFSTRERATNRTREWRVGPGSDLADAGRQGSAPEDALAPEQLRAEARRRARGGSVLHASLGLRVVPCASLVQPAPSIPESSATMPSSEMPSMLRIIWNAGPWKSSSPSYTTSSPQASSARSRISFARLRNSPAAGPARPCIGSSWLPWRSASSSARVAPLPFVSCLQ